MENEASPRQFPWVHAVLIPFVVGIAANTICFLGVFPALQRERLYPNGALFLLSGLNIVIVGIVAFVQTLMGMRPMHRTLAAMAEQQKKAQDEIAAIAARARTDLETNTTKARTEIESKIRAEFQERFNKLERDSAEVRARTGL
jgi:hypothetical protein